jgi:hypothetical protein
MKIELPRQAGTHPHSDWMCIEVYATQTFTKIYLTGAGIAFAGA